LGTFQIESRAQMSMLPRMRPRKFYDIVIEVAIVRPGPIQGDMVHPYLRRREGKEPVDYPSEALREVLEKTLGVPLFQEQAMRVAIVGAGFTAAEADGLRRAMATFKYTGGVTHFMDKLVNGMLANGYRRDFAERTFKQIEGIGSYGFPESHAASFAKIAYASCWMKCHHPDVFCAALLNAQPMGFYAPAQIVRDAREHGVEVRPVCINASRWDCTLGDSESDALSPRGRGIRSLGEPLGELRRSWVRGSACSSQARGAEAPPPLIQSPLSGSAAKLRYPSPPRGEGAGLLPIRLGLRMVRGLSNLDAARILAAREERPFSSIDDVWRRSGVPAAALEKLADADAFRGLRLGRRQALWEVRALGAAPLPLFAAADAREGQWAPEGHEPPVALRALKEGREVVEDYRAVQLSLRAHPLTFLRPQLKVEGRVTTADLITIKDGRKVKLAGIVLIRQRPGSANNVTFVTIEDETGVANIIIWQRLFEAQRRVVLSAAMMGISGRVQKEGAVIHVIADDLQDLSQDLQAVGGLDFPHRTGPGDGAKNGGYDAREKTKQLPAPTKAEREPVKARDLFYPAFRPKPYEAGADTPGIKVKSRDFH